MEGTLNDEREMIKIVIEKLELAQKKAENLVSCLA